MSTQIWICDTCNTRHTTQADADACEATHTPASRLTIKHARYLPDRVGVEREVPDTVIILIPRSNPHSWDYAHYTLTRVGPKPV